MNNVNKEKLEKKLEKLIGKRIRVFSTKGTRKGVLFSFDDKELILTKGDYIRDKIHNKFNIKVSLKDIYIVERLKKNVK